MNLSRASGDNALKAVQKTSAVASDEVISRSPAILDYLNFIFRQSVEIIHQPVYLTVGRRYLVSEHGFLTVRSRPIVGLQEIVP
jgi:hypothetical protein